MLKRQSNSSGVGSSRINRFFGFESGAVALLIVVLACAITFYGWRLLWFLTDDAFISFRYVSNWIIGIGPTWNPPPFQHVEGYSNFLWVVLLSLIWWATGLEAPAVANTMSLLFGLGTVLLVSAWLRQVIVRRRREHYSSECVFLLSLLLIVCNKSFLTWLSSGLETALFTFLVVSWAYACAAIGSRLEDIKWAQAVWLSALLALTRPDGLLFWGLTVALYGVARLRKRVSYSWHYQLSVAVGLFIVPTHVIWRHYYYHDWLPNTYYAKVQAAWPEMGLHYLLSYILEYALYIPALIILVGFGFEGIRKRLAGDWRIGRLLVLACIGIQVLYYVLIVGGDHFEYRVFHHLVPIVVVFMCVFLQSAAVDHRLASMLLLLWLIAQSFIPWTYWHYTKNLYSRAETFGLTFPIADKVISPLRPLTAYWDTLQSLMTTHAICTRHQEHKIFYLFQRAVFPPRADGLAMRMEDHNVLVFGSVGVPGWVFPHAAIIDTLGLNDRLLAKSSSRLRPKHRTMAHSIVASKAYWSCYYPNITWGPDEFRQYSELAQVRLTDDISAGAFGLRPQVIAREEAGIEAQIVGCESRGWTISELFDAAFYVQ